MTRAEDRLYVAGFRNHTKHIADSWYDYIESALGRLSADVRPVPFAYPDVLDAADRAVTEAQQMLQPQKAPTRDKAPAHHTAASVTARRDDAALHWLYHPPAAEPVPPQPLIPSRAGESDGPAEPAVLSPLTAATGAEAQQKFRRGTMIHRLLQVLPDIAAPARANAAAAWLARNAPELGPETVDDIMAVIDHPDFAPLFGPGSLAEVPVTGLTADNQLISGQIDRLVVHDNEVWIVDYKTNREPPQDAANIPAIYKRQMKAYAAIIARIYPGYRVRSFLLWTTGARIMEIPGDAGATP
jgi:ATP-dependent helicase/nuclease subunit A